MRRRSCARRREARGPVIAIALRSVERRAERNGCRLERRHDVRIEQQITRRLLDGLGDGENAETQGRADQGFNEAEGDESQTDIGVFGSEPDEKQRCGDDGKHESSQAHRERKWTSGRRGPLREADRIDCGACVGREHGDLFAKSSSGRSSVMASWRA